MKKLHLITIDRHYKNDGQHAEQCARYTLTGEIVKADNVPFYVKADCLSYQIKGHRATVCKGLDVAEHIAHDKAEAYIYVDRSFTWMYVMSPFEWLQFVSVFGTVTTDSTKKNGGAVKVRLKTEGNAMRAWLESRA